MFGGGKMALIQGLTYSKNFFSQDLRGTFLKVQSISKLSEERLKCDSQVRPSQVYFSESFKDVVRGLHLVPESKSQIPSVRQVFVLHGKIVDFILDCREKSPTRGQLHVEEMDCFAPSILIPGGCAHGYEVISDYAIVGYLESHPYIPDRDQGFNVSSVGIKFRTSAPIISSRDLLLPNWKS